MGRVNTGKGRIMLFLGRSTERYIFSSGSTSDGDGNWKTWEGVILT